VSVPATTRLADGMACRTPVPEALEIIRSSVDHLVEVDDEQVAAAMSLLFTATHNVAEGAGAAALAAALSEKDNLTGQKVGIVVTGGNVDRDVFAGTLA
jgi:threonine dehydratase